jgi:Dual OB-containing domain
MAALLVKRIVCLANSRKMSGRCVAGRELVNGVPGGWVRPVSGRPHEEVSLLEQQYQDGGAPQLLDIVDIPLAAARPGAHQPENWLLDPGFYWVKRGRFDAARLPELLDPPGPLWLNGVHTYNGRNDEIPTEQLGGLGGSLRFIWVPALRIQVFQPGIAFGDARRRVQAQFIYGQEEYRLWVTDPPVEERYLAFPDGVHELGASYLTVSVGEPFGARCYKLVAAVIGGAS